MLCSLCSYSFYDNLVSTRLLPLHRMARWTKVLREHVSLALHSLERLVLHASGVLCSMPVRHGSSFVQHACETQQARSGQAVI